MLIILLLCTAIDNSSSPGFRRLCQWLFAPWNTSFPRGSLLVVGVVSFNVDKQRDVQYFAVERRKCLDRLNYRCNVNGVFRFFVPVSMKYF